MFVIVLGLQLFIRSLLFNLDNGITLNHLEVNGNTEVSWEDLVC